MREEREKVIGKKKQKRKKMVGCHLSLLLPIFGHHIDIQKIQNKKKGWKNKNKYIH